MSGGLTVRLHESHRTDPPPGWAEFAVEQRLLAAWSWPLIRGAAGRHAVIGTIHYGPDTVGLVTGRFIGPRVRRAAAPLASVIDIDGLVSSALPGIVLAHEADTSTLDDAIVALRTAVRDAYGARVRGLMVRQVFADALPAVLARPAIVREGLPVAWFPNRFDSFEQYLRSLGKKRRYDVRRILAAVPASDLSVTSTTAGDPVPVQPAQLCDLIASVVRRHRVAWWMPRRFVSPALAAALLTVPGVHLRGYRDGDRLIGLHVIFDHEHLPLSWGWGAYTVAEGGRRDLWYHSNTELARWCIETGRDGYTSGKGSMVEKGRLGHEMRRQWTVLMPFVPGRG